MQYMLLTRETYDQALEILLKKNKAGALDEAIKLLEKASDLVETKDRLVLEMTKLKEDLFETFRAMPAATTDQKKKLNDKVKRLSVRINDLEKERSAFSRL
jgi:hypothetical protein